MPGLTVDFSGLEELLGQIKQAGGMTDTEVLDCLEAATEAFAGDAKKLPKPISGIRKPGYSHLLSTVKASRDRTRNEIAVGWGKYYGPFLEWGTRKMRARPHLATLWDARKSDYYKMIQKEFERKTGLGL